MFLAGVLQSFGLANSVDYTLALIIY